MVKVFDSLCFGRLEEPIKEVKEKTKRRCLLGKTNYQPLEVN